MSARARRWLLGLVASAGLAFHVLVFATEAPVPAVTATQPQYDDQGALIVPRDFRSWIFVGADLSPRYKSPLPDPAAKSKPESDPDRNSEPETPSCAAIEAEGQGVFHNIYINSESYRAYRKTGKFPDPTILAMEVFEAKDRDAEGVLERGLFEGKRTGIEFAVKDSRRPGGGVPWAYYAFSLDGQGQPARSARARNDRACYDCHLKHASVDNVWVQFYPVLRDPE